MSCETKLSNPVIINNLITKDQPKLYAFVGNELNENMKKISLKTIHTYFQWEECFSNEQ